MSDEFQELPEDEVLLQRMEAWLKETRPAAPAGLAAGVMEAIDNTAAARTARRPQGWIARLAPRRAWVWAPVAAAAAILLLLALRGDRPRQPAGSLAAGPFAQREVDAESLRAALSPADSVRCVFEFAAKEAHEVCLVGNFNLWKVCDTPLRRTSAGNWAVSVQLPRGRYEYVFVVDGQWVADPAAAVKVDDGFGGQKAILLL
jgi:hypothetical protein